MKELTCVVIGGGYAGIHAIKAIQKEMGRNSNHQLRMILIDKQPYHMKKVLLFKPAAKEQDITIPWKHLFSKKIHSIQGSVIKVSPEEKKVLCEKSDGVLHVIDYDILVMAIGSVVKTPGPEKGGIALSDVNAATTIRDRWTKNLKTAMKEQNPHEQKRLMTVAVAGAGISGIEASAEMVFAMKEEAQALGLDPEKVQVLLVNSQKRLLMEGPLEVGIKLERELAGIGVKVIQGCKAIKEQDQMLELSGIKGIPVGLCVWTLGLLPNPILKNIGLPLTPKGQVEVDHSYRVQGAPFVYSIGDCASIIDPKTGRADQMTCREASMQAARLGKVIFADITNQPAPVHKEALKVFCFGLGPNRGLAWIRLMNRDFVLSGRLGCHLRTFTWNLASLGKK